MVATSHLPLFLCFLSFFIISRGLKIARGAPSNAEVMEFPGYDGEMPSKHYAGYISLKNQDIKKHFHYYFATSERNPSLDPLTFFLTGGPGCSGLTALIHILGPFKVENNVDFRKAGPKVKLNSFSWTKVTNVIFIDSPIFTGYSYAEENKNLKTNGDEMDIGWSTFVSEVANRTQERSQSPAMDDSDIVADLYEFIRKWFFEFPEFLANPFYVAGSSYAGIWVAALSHEIAKGIEIGHEPRINFKGYSLGSGAIDVHIEKNAAVPFAHRMGFITDELYMELTKSCNGNYWDNNDPRCQKNVEVFQELVKGINKYHILCLPCHKVIGNEFQPHESESIEEYHSLEKKPQSGIYCYDYDERARSLFNPQSSREILHAHPEELAGEWRRCKTLPQGFKRNLVNLIPYHLNLTMKGYRAFLYTGDHDMVIPPAANLEWIKKLNYSVVEGWRPWLVDDEHVAGYTILYDHNLLFATFKGAGHTVPEYTPREALIAHERWFGGSNSL